MNKYYISYIYRIEFWAGLYSIYGLSSTIIYGSHIKPTEDELSNFTDKTARDLSRTNKNRRVKVAIVSIISIMQENPNA